MRILVLSDLHREIWRDHAPSISPESCAPDVAIIAGDIGVGAQAVGWAEETFKGIPVLYVAGNHESYGRSLESAEQEIAEACVGTENVHFLNCAEFEHDGVRFLGATLWTDFCLFGEGTQQASMKAAESVMMDYKRICLASEGNRELQPLDTTRFHAQQRAWLQHKLLEPYAGKTVVITHMAPSLKSIVERYAADPVSAGFASNLDDLAVRADLWIHGHTHSSLDYQIGKCRVVCNPCGYIMRSGSPENPNFDPNFCVEL